MRISNIFITAVLTISLVLTGCSDSSKKLQEAHDAQNNGDIAKAVKIYASVVRGITTGIKFPDSKKGAIIAPEDWKVEVEKYFKDISKPNAKLKSLILDAVENLQICIALGESDNTARIHEPKPLDEAAFVKMFNSVFSPHPASPEDWNAVSEFAIKNKFSILQITSPANYTYDVSVVSAQSARRLDFTLYPDNKLIIPLPPGAYGIIVKSNVAFQQGQYWTSEYSGFLVNIPKQEKPSLVSMDLRTKVIKKQ